MISLSKVFVLNFGKLYVRDVHLVLLVTLLSLAHTAPTVTSNAACNGTVTETGRAVVGGSADVRLT